MHLRLLLLLFIALPHCSFGQDSIRYINSREALQTGIAMYDTGNYKGALEKFRLVHECDTNYALAVYEQVLALQADSSFEDAFRLVKSGLMLPEANRRDFLLLLANCYDYLGKHDSALETYSNMMSLFPNDHQPYYESGIVYLNQKEYDKAESSFQRAALINPYHFRTQYMLGKLYAIEGRLTEAMMALHVSLLLTKNIEVARSSIRIITAITDETDEINKSYMDKAARHSHPLYDEIDQIVNARLALSEKYKLKTSISENIFRQLQVIMEKLTYSADDTSFTMQYYVPMFTELYGTDNFESAVLLLYSNFGFENIDQLAAKKNRGVEGAKKIVFPYLNKIRATRVLDNTKRKQAADLYHFLSDDQLILVGTTTSVDDNTIITGDATIYRTSHSLVATGKYNNQGKKEGNWRYYYANGKLKAVEFSDNGVATDTSTDYFSNGNVKKISVLDKQGKITFEAEYDYKGWLSATSMVLAGGAKRITSYHDNGIVEYSLLVKDQKVIDGIDTFYYNNGSIQKIVTYKDGEANGDFKKYYRNGQLSEYCNYVAGKLDGENVEYYESGKQKNKYTYRNGKANGSYTDYYENGNLMETGTFEKGEKTGRLTKYNEDGKEYGYIDMKKDVPSHLKFFKPDGSIVFEKSDKNGMYEYPLYHSNLVKAADMRINETGYRNGVILFYGLTGSKIEEVSYKNGNKEGPSKTFYRDGSIRTAQTYVADKLDGYYITYHANGVPNETGWYKNGAQQGLWKTYWPNGKLKYESFLLNGKTSGYFKDYNINGDLEYKYLYDDNMIVGAVTYGPNGKVLDSQYYAGGRGWMKLPNKSQPGLLEYQCAIKYGALDGPFVRKFQNGNMHETGFYKNGKKDSSYVSYFPDGSKKSWGNYDEGAKTGTWQLNNEAGLPEMVEYYDIAAKKHRKDIYAGNEIRITYAYTDGERDSAQIYRGENGQLACILLYKGGILTGYTYQDKNGQLMPITPVANATAQFTTYYPNGSKSAEFNYRDNVVIGTQKLYFSNGQLAEERNYKSIDLNGPFRRYTPGGKLRYETNYLDDETHGHEKTFDNNGILLIDRECYYGYNNGNTSVTDIKTQKTTTYRYSFGNFTGSN